MHAPSLALTSNDANLKLRTVKEAIILLLEENSLTLIDVLLSKSL